MPDWVQTESDSKPIGLEVNDRSETSVPLPINPIAESLTRIADYSERQREKNAPTLIQLSNTNTTIVTWQRLRFEHFLITCATGDHISLTVGTRVYDFFMGPVSGTIYVPFPIEVDRGVDLTFTNVTASGHVSYIYIFAYTE